MPNNVFAQVTDTDGDGIPDSSDSCPTQAETFNGVEDTDGCPDVVAPKDTDNDGIDDKIDSCPTQAETFNGVEDSDGCPDVATLQDSDKDGIIN
ncbi:MAG: thrombospondin, partial [Nitrosopumilales archaeon CG_4_9_14_0_8_um_filter_34_10]